MLNDRQFARRLIEDPSTPDVIQGDVARRVMRAANVRSWPIHEMASMARPQTYSSGVANNETSISPHETVHTAQSHLHVPTLRRYLNYDEPEHDADYGDDVPYHPAIVESPRGHLWMDEGHHRVVASRLRGDLSREAWLGRIGDR